jgi:hypothetical protein
MTIYPVVEGRSYYILIKWECMDKLEVLLGDVLLRVHAEITENIIKM